MKEEILREHLPPKGTPTCRYCKWFIRVKESGKLLNIRGFCAFGQGEGCFDLYVSSSTALSCSHFVFDEFNYRIEKELRKIKNKIWRESDKIERELSREFEKRRKSKRSKTPFKNILEIMMISKRLAYERVVKEKFDEIKKIHDMISFNEKDYRKILDALQTLVFIFLDGKVMKK